MDPQAGVRGSERIVGRWRSGRCWLGAGSALALIWLGAGVVLASPGFVAPVGPGPQQGGDVSVHLLAPRDGEMVAGIVQIRAQVDADRSEDVSFVEFYVDGRLMLSDAKPPYELVWHAGEPAQHEIVATVFGPTGRIAQDTVRTRAPSPVAGAAYRSRVERVEVYVQVEDRRHGDVSLGPDDFVVLEDDVPQRIVDVTRSTELPLAVGLMVDCSGSMLGKLAFALDTAGSFIDGLMTQGRDKAFVMSFSDLPSVLQEFTNDVPRLEQALDLVSSGRYTRLYDSIIAAARQFRGQDGRRALVVLTDGHDADSEASLEDAVKAAQRANVAIYPVAVDLSTRFFFERWVLERLARATGGRVASLQTLDDPRRIYEGISRDLRAQYRITYEPLRPGGDGSWRSIQVRLSPDSPHRHAHLRARPGYFAE